MVGWQDSALIRAARAGRCLVAGRLSSVDVTGHGKALARHWQGFGKWQTGRRAKVDEADKAPLEARHEALLLLCRVLKLCCSYVVCGQ